MSTFSLHLPIYIIMSLIAIDTPKTTFNSVESRAASVSQLRWTYTRKDGTFTTVSKTGGDKLILNDWTLEASASVGDRIYVKFDDDVVNAEGTITALLAAPVRIETDIDYSSATTARAGFANNFDLRPNYRVKATIAEFTDFESYYTSGAEGLTVINLGKAVKDLLLQNNLKYSDITMSRLEVWDASAESPTAETEILTTLSIRQILQTHGANLWSHLMQTGTYEGIIYTRFPDDFNKLWSGWKRTASVLIDPLASGRLTGSTVSWITRDLNQNKIFQAAINSVAITLTTAKIEEYDFNGGADFGSDYYTQLYVIAIPPSNTVTNSILYRNLEECRKPIMIEWLNSYGAYDQWLFELNQVFDNEAKEGIIYDIGINDDIENISANKGRNPDGFSQKITLQADQLTKGQIRALNEIKFSTEVRIFLSKDGTSYVNAVVSAGYSDTFESKGTFFEYFLSLQLPDNFDLFDHLEYTL